MKEKFYITTPIYYVNDAPHLGHGYTSVLADVLARYQGFLGAEIFFLTGTDEHGAKVSRAAEEKGESVSSFVEKNFLKFQELAKTLNISNSDFIRTSDQKKHWPGVKKLWEVIQGKGDIYKSKYHGFYCVGCEAFVTEKDLVDGKCVYHNIKPEMIEEENYFFRLSKYGLALKKLVESGEVRILPESRKNETLSFIAEGLTDISISRPGKDIPWGVPVPGDDSQTVYVWFEALCNYISGLGYGGDETLFNKFWPADWHILAKDIMRFHTIIWPAMLLSAGLSLPKNFLVHGFINIGGHKMSKTIGNVVDPFDVIRRYGVDALRYYFCRELTPFEDGDFTEDKFKAAYNANLANGLGNYTSRVFKMALSYFSGIVKKPDDVLLNQVSFGSGPGEDFSVPYVFEHTFWPEYKKFFGEIKINEAAGVIWSALSQLDTYVQAHEPFKLIKTNPVKTEAVLWSLLFGLANISQMLYPFMPETAEKIMRGLGIDQGQKEVWGDFSLTPMENLFPRKE